MEMTLDAERLEAQVVQVGAVWCAWVAPWPSLVERGRTRTEAEDRLAVTLEELGLARRTPEAARAW
jgi:polyferredoxin